MSRRWLVERKPGWFEDFGYDSMSVLDSGALRFHDGTIFQPRNVFVLAAGQWISVMENDDDA